MFFTLIFHFLILNLWAAQKVEVALAGKKGQGVKGKRSAS